MNESASSSAPARVLLVEDDSLLLRQLSGLLSEQEDFEVVAAVEAAEQALQRAESAELAVVDLGLPDMNGADLIRRLRAEHPELEIMAHTIYEDRPTVFEAIVAGATSYVLKGLGAEAFLRALRELRAGGSPMSPKIARAVVGAFQRQGSVADRYSLSARERQVLRHLESGFTYDEVATELCISRHTVHTHIKRIYEKLHAHDRAEALTKARMRGIL